MPRLRGCVSIRTNLAVGAGVSEGGPDPPLRGRGAAVDPVAIALALGGASQEPAEDADYEERAGNAGACCLESGLDGVLPAPAPTASPTTAAPDEASKHKKRYCAQGGIDDCGENTSPEMNAESRQQCVAYEGADDADDDVANDAKPCSYDEVPSQPPGDKTHQQNDKDALVR